MYRLAAILLIPCLVMGNSLAHAHGSAAHSFSSSLRPHVHVGKTSEHAHGHDSHGHSHRGHGGGHHGDGQHGDHHHHHHHAVDHEREHSDTSTEPIERSRDHESDAVYVAAADLMVASSERVSIESLSCALGVVVEETCACVRTLSRLDRPPIAKAAPFPRFLLYAALRL